MSAMILGVAGVTGSGKTTVAREILEAVRPDRIAFLAQDNYYRDVDWESPEQLLAYNFDHPDAIDTPLFVEHLRALKNGCAVELPVYDFVSHRRTTVSRRIEPRPVNVKWALPSSIHLAFAPVKTTNSFLARKPCGIFPSN